MDQYIAEVINQDGCIFDHGTFDTLEDAKEFCKGRGRKYIGNVIKLGKETPYGIEETLVATYR